MVGVPKSSCFICRKRKIKCDEGWPVCRNCEKNGKCCPGPPSRHTFKDTGPRMAEANPTIDAGSTSDLVLQDGKLTQINERWSDNGTVVHKFRISQKQQPRKPSRSPRLVSAGTSRCPSPHSPMYRLPSPSQHQELARVLVESITMGLSSLGPFIRDVPGRIGHNDALDAAVACLVHAHSALVHKGKGRDIASPKLYLRAVQTLQTCLDDPQQGRSANTLCATVLLGLVEALAGPRAGNRYLAHVGGAGRLLELQGPRSCQDQFSKEILRFIRGGIIVTSIYQRKPCFLKLPEWRDIAFDTTGLSFNDCLYTELLQHMADFPALLQAMKKLEDPIQTNPQTQAISPQNMNSRDTLLKSLHKLKSSLTILGTHLTANLASGTVALELPATSPDSPSPTAYHFTAWRIAVAYNCYWALLILTNRLIMKLLSLPTYGTGNGSMSSDNVAASYTLTIHDESRAAAREICKTWEYAWKTRPIGALHVGLSFVVAYDFCEEESTKQWILDGLNAFLADLQVDSFRWEEDVVRMMSGRLGGEGEDLVFSSGGSGGGGGGGG